jgi:sulfonate transport system substrate-binding protein
MPLTRRQALAAGLTVPIAGRARAAGTKTLRAGFQKGEPILMGVQVNQSLEKRLAPLGYSVTWTEFQFGPPMLEAMRAGSIDFGGVGDTPPIFAQAAHSDLVYVAGQRAGLSAILVPQSSQVRSIQDMKGKRIAFARGSSAHGFLLMTLEKAGLRYDEIQPVALAPADATAAFERGAIDAWSIWDPYVSLFQARPGVRTLVTNDDIGEQNSFFIAARQFAQADPKVTDAIIDTLIESAAWGAQHRPELSRLLASVTGLPEPIMQKTVEHLPFKVMRMNADLVTNQQKIADRFSALGILPVSIKVTDAVWHAGA